MKKIVFLFLVLTSTQLFSQKKINTKHPSGYLVGYANREAFDDAKFYWFNKNYKAYTTDKKTIKKLQKSLKNISVAIFMGTWCHDSKRVIPRFYKIMDEAGFNTKENLKLVAINRAKETPDNLQAGHNIKRTPTIIFYKKGKEIGRFVEHAIESLEKDILKIIKNKPYKHPYQK